MPENSLSAKDVTLRYMKYLERRVKTLERREYIWIGKSVGLWIAVVYLVFNFMGVG